MGALALPAALLLTYLTMAAAAVAPGDTLRPTDPPSLSWSSPNATFSLRFLPTATSSSSYTLSVAYASTPLWMPTATAVDSAAALQFTSSGDLRLVNRSGAVVWQTDTANLGVTSAEVDDSGNLVLRNASATVWQSFEHPTDTLVETQNFTTRMTLRSGLYSFAVVRPGNLTLRWNDSITYYNQGLNSSFDSNFSLAAPTLVLESIGRLTLFDPSLNNPVYVAYSSNYGESGERIRFLRLGDDGNLRAYSIPVGGGNSGQPAVQWSAIEDQCEVFGFCGNMGICSYDDDNGGPICGCPSQNFEFLDPNDPRQGCGRRQELRDCPSRSTMLQLNRTRFFTYPPETSTDLFFAGVGACSANCLNGAACVASTSLADGSGMCYIKNSPFVSGYQSPSLPSTSFVKVCSPAMPNEPARSSDQSRGSSSLSGGIVAIIIVATVVALAVAEFGVWWWFCRNNAKFGSLSAQYALLEYASGAPVQFSYKELQRSTNGFKEKLGAGGFGAVYKGVLANKTVVAVKRLEGIEQGEKQFRMEVATISSTHHLNLVRLIGFCSEGRHRLLVYEFMRNGSLDGFLFSADDSSGKSLNWDVRFGIALGTARGITYLHEECRDCIVHCDIKPENVLLDENFNAKVSDFGLAKLVHPKDHRQRTLTSVHGTRGYLAPEWLANLPITSKSDVYSFGMVLLEIISGKRNFDVSERSNRKKFSLWAYEEFDKGNTRNILDSRLADQEVNLEQLERAVQVSFWCIQEQPSQRPTMGKIVQMLEGIITVERPPVPKALEGSLGSSTASGSASTLSTFATSAREQYASSSLPVSSSQSQSGRNFGNSSSFFHAPSSSYS